MSIVQCEGMHVADIFRRETSRGDQAGASESEKPAQAGDQKEKRAPGRGRNQPKQETNGGTTARDQAGISASEKPAQEGDQQETTAGDQAGTTESEKPDQAGDQRERPQLETKREPVRARSTGDHRRRPSEKHRERESERPAQAGDQG